MRILIGTKNRGKLEEIREILSEFDIEGISPEEAGIRVDAEEGGESLEENALIKAKAYSEASGLLSLSEDSGLFVDALSGRPGVFSSRYGRDDRERCEKVLRELEGVPWEKRSAYFECVAILASPEGKVWVRRGKARGYITFEMRGEGGFGYDPIFFSPEAGKTFAELKREEKSKISHRGRAIREIGKLILRLKLKEIEIKRLREIVKLLNTDEAFLKEIDGGNVYRECVEKAKNTKLSEIEGEVLERFLKKWGWLRRIRWKREELARKIKEIAPDLEEIRGEDITRIEIEKHEERIKRLYGEIRGILGGVGASKVLHLLAPDLFPPWDNPIEKAIKGEKGGEDFSPDLYLEFMKFAKEIIEENREKFDELAGRYGKTKVKILDEYLWWTISRRPLFPLAGGGI